MPTPSLPRHTCKPTTPSFPPPLSSFQDCPPGHACPAGAVRPRQCASGFFADMKAAFCRECPKGQFQNQAGQRACKVSSWQLTRGAVGGSGAATACPVCGGAAATACSAGLACRLLWRCPWLLPHLLRFPRIPLALCSPAPPARTAPIPRPSKPSLAQRALSTAT